MTFKLVSALTVLCTISSRCHAKSRHSHKTLDVWTCSTLSLAAIFIQGKKVQSPSKAEALNVVQNVNVRDTWQIAFTVFALPADIQRFTPIILSLLLYLIDYLMFLYPYFPESSGNIYLDPYSLPNPAFTSYNNPNFVRVVPPLPHLSPVGSPIPSLPFINRQLNNHINTINNSLILPLLPYSTYHLSIFNLRLFPPVRYVMGFVLSLAKIRTAFILAQDVMRLCNLLLAGR